MEPGYREERISREGPELEDDYKYDAQVGIRIRVVCVTGRHDRPLHYLGSRCRLSRLPDSNRGHRGSRAVTVTGTPYYSRALYQAELRRVLCAYQLGRRSVLNISLSDTGLARPVEFYRSNAPLVFYVLTKR